jgi:hypothetical protein
MKRLHHGLAFVVAIITLKMFNHSIYLTFEKFDGTNPIPQEE